MLSAGMFEDSIDMYTLYVERAELCVIVLLAH
jgi:hypothetical protein